MTPSQIKHMVDRFLGWRLPKPWHPDNGISYKRPNYAHDPSEHDWPTGTNLFDATQAEAMVRYMIDGLPVDSEHDLAAAQSRIAVLEAERNYFARIIERIGNEVASYNNHRALAQPQAAEEPKT